MSTLPLPTRGVSPWPATLREIAAFLLCAACTVAIAMAVLFPVESRVYLHDAIVAVRDAVFAAVTP